jgi:molybdopterin converting factor small subunit
MAEPTTRSPAQRHRPGQKPKPAATAAVAVAPKPRVTVKLGGPLMSAAGGQTEFTVEAATINEMLKKLGEAYANLKPVLDKSVTVVVDGHVYRGAWMQPLKETSEIYLLPPLTGG